MDHGQIQNRFSAYLDGEIGDPERAQIEAHCRECGECAAILADLREVSGLVRGSRAALSAAMMPRLHQAIDAKM